MSIASWQLYDLDACEAEFTRILITAIPPVNGLPQIIRSRSGISTTTPRIQVILQTQQNYDQRKILNPANTNTEFQPLNTWFFQLGVAISTERERNTSQHAELVARCREALQFYKLAQSWTSEVFTLANVREQPEVPTIDDTGNTDITTLTISGMICIRDGAWSQVA